MAEEEGLPDDAGNVHIKASHRHQRRLIQDHQSLPHFAIGVKLPSDPAQVFDRQPPQTWDALDELDDPVRDIDQIEQGHEQEGSELEVMDLPSQAAGPVEVVADGHIEDDGDDDDVDELGDVGFVHD